MEALPVAVILANDEGKINYLNVFAENMFGYREPELRGQRVESLLNSAFYNFTPEFWDQFFSQPASATHWGNNECQAQLKNGNKIPVEVQMNPIETVKNKYVLITITNITERVKVTEQLRLVVESTPNAMVLTDAQGKIALVNKQTEMLFGYQRNELIGKNVEILVPERMKQHHPKYRQKFQEHPKARPMGAGRDLFGVKKDGTEIPVEIGLNPVEKDGKRFVLASVIDITERKKNEEAIHSYARQLAEKNKELEEFTNVASHDLREPLNSIISFTELLKQRKSNQLDEEGLKMIDYISMSSARMSELIIGLLDYARLGNSKELRMTDLNELLTTVLLDLDSSIKASDAIINVGNLPILNVFTMEFRLLLQNLISNALKYRKPDVSPKISVSADKVQDGWLFKVSDNGIGIPENQTEKVFNLFHRAHRRSEYEGTGIGLAHCRKIAELHKGRIWVESEQNIGSTFFLHIPSGLF